MKEFNVISFLKTVQFLLLIHLKVHYRNLIMKNLQKLSIGIFQKSKFGRSYFH